MKKNILKFFAIGAMAFLFACRPYVKLIETEGAGLSKTDDKYVYFENDTLRVTYFMWADRGQMAFSVYNKLNIPLYIDWKKSAFVMNGFKYRYYTQKAESDNQMTTTNAGSKNSFISQKSITTFEERVTFIPPKASVYNPLTYVIMKYDKLASNLTTVGKRIKIETTDIRHDKTASKVSVPKSWKKSGTTYVYEKSYTAAESPMTFRNFLTYSTTEKFETEQYVDNEFHVKKLTEMKDKQFNGKVTKGKETIKRGNKTVTRKIRLYEMPYKASNCYYIPLGY